MQDRRKKKNFFLDIRPPKNKKLLPNNLIIENERAKGKGRKGRKEKAGIFKIGSRSLDALDFKRPLRYIFRKKAKKSKKKFISRPYTGNINTTSEIAFSRKKVLRFSYKIFEYSFLFSAFFLLLLSIGSLFLQRESLNNRFFALKDSSENHLLSAEEAALKYDIETTKKELELAEEQIMEAKKIILKKGLYCYYLDQTPLFSGEIVSAKRSLQIGTNLVNLGKSLSRIFSDDLSIEKVIAAGDELKSAKKSLRGVEEDIKKLKNGEDLGSLVHLEDKISSFENLFSVSEHALEILPKIIGEGDEKKKYLLLFLNNAELRPSGGFIGTYGEIAFDSGIPEKPKVNNSHALKDEYKTNLDEIREDGDFVMNFPNDLLPPKFIREEINSNFFELHESNWSVDFEKSAKRELYLMENIYGGEKFDGVIALNPAVIESILEKTGAIDMPEYKTELTDKNFREVIEYKVEIDNPFRKERKADVNPKQILVDFAPKLIEKIASLSSGQKLKLYEGFYENLKKKDILVYSQDQSVQNFLSEMNFAGTISRENEDYLMVNFANISAKKTSNKVKKNIELRTTISPEGEILHKINLTLVHTGEKRYVHDGIDVNLIQIIVPKGSKLDELYIEGKDSLSKVESYIEDEKNVFAFFASVKPKTAKNIFVSYSSGFRFNQKSYTLNVAKQPGLSSANLDFSIETPSNLLLSRAEPNRSFKEEFDIDKKIELLFE